MIGKITRGERAGDIAAYLHGPGTTNLHIYGGRVGGAVIGGNLGQEGDRRGVAWARELRAAASVRPEIRKPIWQVSLRCAPEDRTLTDEEWAEASQLFAERMGFSGHPWVVVRHASDHVHIVASRVSDTGSVWHARHDYREAQSARRMLEERYGLQPTAVRTSEASRRTPDHQTKRGERAHGLRTSSAPARVVLATRVRSAADAAAGAGADRFEEALRRLGVDFRKSVASTGRVSGYSFSHELAVDADGKRIWFKASQLDRELAWSKLGERLDDPAEAPVSPAMVRRGPLEPAGVFELRRVAAHEQALRELFERRLRAIMITVAEQLHRIGDWWESTPLVSAARQDWESATAAHSVASMGAGDLRIRPDGFRAIDRRPDAVERHQRDEDLGR